MEIDVVITNFNGNWYGVITTIIWKWYGYNQFNWNWYGVITNFNGNWYVVIESFNGNERGYIQF